MCRFEVGPDDLPDLIFSSIGRTVWRDIGGVALSFRMMMKLVDFNLMARAAPRTRVTHWMLDLLGVAEGLGGLFLWLKRGLAESCRAALPAASFRFRPSTAHH